MDMDPIVVECHIVVGHRWTTHGSDTDVEGQLVRTVEDLLAEDGYGVTADGKSLYRFLYESE